MGSEAFAWGVLAGSILGPFACPLFAAMRSGIKLRPRLELKHFEVRSYIWRALPVMLGFSIVVLDDMLVKRGASQLAEGLVSQLHYARTLMKVPMGVFGLAMGMATFPSISRHLAQGQSKEAFGLLQKAASTLLILVGLSQAVLSIASPEAVALIWGKERLSLMAINHIGAYCAFLSLGLWAWSSQGLLARGFYAQGKTWLPTLLGSVLVLCFYPLYEFLSSPAAITISDWISQNIYEIGLGAGLALCSSLAISAYVVLLWLALCYSFGQSVSEIYKFLWHLFKIEFAVLVSINCTSTVFSIGINSGSSYMQLLITAGLKSILSSFTFILMCYAMRIHEVKTLIDRIKHKLKRSP